MFRSDSLRISKRALKCRGVSRHAVCSFMTVASAFGTSGDPAVSPNVTKSFVEGQSDDFAERFNVLRRWACPFLISDVLYRAICLKGLRHPSVFQMSWKPQQFPLIACELGSKTRHVFSLTETSQQDFSFSTGTAFLRVGICMWLI